MVTVNAQNNETFALFKKFLEGSNKLFDSSKKETHLKKESAQNDKSVKHIENNI